MNIDINNILIIFVLSMVANIIVIGTYLAGREFADVVIYIVKKKMDLLFNRENKLK